MLPISADLANRASFGKIQLWAELERKVDQLGLQVRPGDIFLLYAPSDGDGAGKVYGGCYGQAETDGRWYAVFAYGPIGAAKVRTKDVYYPSACAGESTARRIYSQKHSQKLGRYRPAFPGDQAGQSIQRCGCGTSYALGAHCHVCQPRAARASCEADAQITVRLTASRSAQLPPVKPDPPSGRPKVKPAPEQPGSIDRDVLSDFGTNTVRW